MNAKELIKYGLCACIGWKIGQELGDAVLNKYGAKLSLKAKAAKAKAKKKIDKILEP